MNLRIIPPEHSCCFEARVERELLKPKCKWGNTWELVAEFYNKEDAEEYVKLATKEA